MKSDKYTRQLFLIQNGLVSMAHIPTDFLVAMPPDQAILLTALLNICWKKRTSTIPCSIYKLQAILHMDANKQNRLLRLFKKRGFITVERKGKTGKRWITVHGRDVMVWLEKRLGFLGDH